MRRKSLKGFRTVITGASSGIGRALALRLGDAGARLLLTARRTDRLAEVVAEINRGPGNAIHLAGDITEPDHRAALLIAAERKLGGLDLLINNAGVGAYGPFATADPHRLRQIMEVNFFAPVELIRNALPLLTQGTRPMIVNVSSVLGHFSVPDRAEYCASKFAIHGMSDALCVEFRPLGIDVLLVSPSKTESEFVESLLERTDGAYTPKHRGMSSDRVAQLTIRAIRRGRREIILSAGGGAMVWLDRICPPLMRRILTRFTR